MSNQPQTRTLQSYIDSLPLGLDPLLIGAGLKRVPAASEGVPAGGSTGQALVKSSDNDYEVEWETLQFLNSVQPGTGIAIDDTDPLNPIIAVSGGGVTSVGVSVPTGFAVANSPITSAGTITISYTAGYQGYTSAEATKLSDISSGADVTGAAINAATNKTAPGDTDKFGLWDGALKAVTWANVKATLKTHFDTLYGALATANQWVKPQRTGITALTSGATITIDGSTLGGNIMSLTLGHNATMANPTNLADGTTFSIFGQQDATGGRTLSYASNWNPIGSSSAPAVPSGANAKFRIDGQVGPSGRIDYTTRGVGV